MRYSKISSKVIRTAKTLHLNNQIIHSNNKIKTVWNIIKCETGRLNIKHDKVNICNTDKKYNESINVEIFNKYFLTVANNISCKIMGSHKQIQSSAKVSSFLSQAFNFPFTNTVYHNTSTGKIEKIIHSFMCKNSCGYDEICMKILKASALFVSSPLCHIINTSLNSGAFPTRFKYCIIM